MARKPKIRTPNNGGRPPTTIAYYGWDNLGDVHATLSQLEMGQFQQAAIMFDAMTRDDRFSAVLSTRLLRLQTVPIDLKVPKGYEENAKAIEIAESLGGTEGGPTEWDRMYPAADVANLHKWGIGVGVGVGQQVWVSDDGLWKPRLRIWHPQHLRWDEAMQRYIIRQYLGPDIVLPDVHENRRSDGEWILYCPYGYHDAWLAMSLVRGVAVTILDRTFNRVDWSRFNEKYGKPIELVKVPATWPQEKKDELFDGVATRHGETTVMLETGVADDGSPLGADMALVESKSTGWDTFQARKKENDTDIAIRVLGQNLTTEVTDGKGSLGVDGQKATPDDYLTADTGIAVVLYDQGLSHYAELNYGDAKLAPIPVYRTAPPEDAVALAQAKSAIINALSVAKSSHMPVDERAELEDAGVVVRSQEEIDAEAALASESGRQLGTGSSVLLTPSAQGTIITVNEARASIGLGPLRTPEGAEDPDGWMTIADYQAKLEANKPKQESPFADDADGDEYKDAPPATKDGKVALAAKKPPNVVKRYMFQGHNIAVENPAGTVREWPGGSTRMQHDYGFIEGHMAWDDDEVDVYIGPNEKASHVYVVHQLAVPTYDRYDEDKVMMGFDSYDQALRAYVAHRNDGDKAIRNVTAMPVAEFHRKLARRKGQGPIRASARIETTRALLALTARAGADVAALRGSGDGKKLRSADRLVANGTRLAASALAPYLASMKDEIAKATSFEDLQQRVLERFKSADPATLADAIAKTRILARLSGMLSAKKETKAA